MILQALTEYYNRKEESSPGEIAPFGFERKPIEVIVEINGHGEMVQLIVRDKKHEEIEELVPISVKRSSNILPNLLWDTVEYALGITRKQNERDQKKCKRVSRQHSAFVQKIEAFPTDDEAIRALRVFLNEFNPENKRIDAGREFLSTNPYVSFRFQGDSFLICQRPEIRGLILDQANSSGEKTRCLVTGEIASIARLHHKIKGVKDAHTSGASIVSFNRSAFDSYGKEKGLNSPIGEKASFEYATALNQLLRKDSEQCIHIAGTSTVFWSEKQTQLETDFGLIFGATTKTIDDDPDKYTHSIKSIFSSVKKGRYVGEDDGQLFYVLGLAPNNSRISIRYWQVATLAEISIRIKEHFEHFDMVRSSHEKTPFLPLNRILANIAANGELKNIPPKIAGEFVRSIFVGEPYPYTILVETVRRCKVERKVNYPRAATIKACLNRRLNEEDLKMSLDINNSNVAYRLGRLFALLEKIQEEANPNLNATIRDRYYGAASSNPVSVIATLLKLKNHHLVKLSVGRRVNFEKLLGEVMDKIPPDIPASLDLQDQGRFAVGYYHQRNDLFKSKINNDSGEKE